MKKILPVDDNIDVQEIISQYFAARTQYKIITTEDGEIALDQLNNDPPDLIIIDIFCPVITSYPSAVQT